MIELSISEIYHLAPSFYSYVWQFKVKQEIQEWWLEYLKKKTPTIYISYCPQLLLSPLENMTWTDSSTLKKKGRKNQMVVAYLFIKVSFQS